MNLRLHFRFSLLELTNQGRGEKEGEGTVRETKMIGTGFFPIIFALTGKKRLCKVKVF